VKSSAKAPANGAARRTAKTAARAPAKRTGKSPAPAKRSAKSAAPAKRSAKSAAKDHRGLVQTPDDRLERSLCDEGMQLVAGLDEVGRGAWAGPVSVGVVVFPDDLVPPDGLRDSKMLTEDAREALYPLITQWCSAWSVGHADPGECDSLGMTAALRLAARRALDNLSCQPRVVLMDGAFDYVSEPVDPNDEPVDPTGPAVDLNGPASKPSSSPQVRTVVRGDASCVSIAAASIMAKVTRDRMMRAMSTSFPPFDFDRNKGYPSPVHRTALAGFGLTSIHRRSWSFVDEMAFR
jgi:ribonuclease HII